MSEHLKLTNRAEVNPPEPRLFTVTRNFDQSGISGTGRILDGVVFHNGQVVVCWRSDVNEKTPGFSSLGIYPSWEAFMHVHIDPHPVNKTEIRFLDE
jgi:hypothetical protein